MYKSYYESSLGIIEVTCSNEYFANSVIVKKTGEVIHLNPVKDVLNYSADFIERFSIGDKVKHAIFGQGIIIAINVMILTVSFCPPQGIKNISSSYKELELV